MSAGLWFPGPILAIETSCDETSAAVVVGRSVRSNVVSSQAKLHERWGGVVPEAAARAHVESLIPVVTEALAPVGLSGIEAIAVTNRPGLAGALTVGISAAKTLSMALAKPLVGVHHLEGHLLSPYIEADVPLPHLALIVSGGHTELVEVQDLGAYRILAQTLDDAAGEAFDKGARLLGLGNPGGPRIQEAAQSGNSRRYELPRALARDAEHFSFSGLKTAMLRLVEREGAAISVPDAAASLQQAIVDSLVTKTIAAMERTGLRSITVVGGVAANTCLRAALDQECRSWGARVFVPSTEYCTDNAAMIGIAGSHRLAQGQRDGLELDAYARADLPESCAVQDM